MDANSFNQNLDEPLPEPTQGEVIHSIGRFEEKKSKLHSESIKKCMQNKVNKRREQRRNAKKARKRNRK